jgi:segregation and condensation protein B
MSLKAKLEAVIYAAEEPVTLAQLALLFTSDALQWKAEQDAAAAAARAAESEAASEPQPLIEDAFVTVEGDEIAGTTAVAVAPDQGEAQAAEATLPAESAAENGAEAVPAAGTDAAASSDAEQPAAPADSESELKREARQRDRDVRNVLRTLLEELIAEYAADGRGIEIREVAGGYRMATKPEYHDAVRGFVKGLKPPLKLSLPALETLAVIAYKQPVTAPEVNEIRGVDSSGVFGSLLSRKLIATAGRKQVVGRPMLYKTTREFLLRFGLKDVSELPSMEEFEKLAASELEEAAQTEEEAGAAASGESPELDETASEEAEMESAASNPTETAAHQPSQENAAASMPPDENEAAKIEAVTNQPAATEPAEIEQTSHD